MKYYYAVYDNNNLIGVREKEFELLGNDERQITEKEYFELLETLNEYITLTE